MLFYDDSWVGTEPCSPDFRAFGFDGIIKCLFSGFEARLCASVDTPVHELRMHPYLFPTGVNGEPSFLSGGDPESEVLRYWLQLRPALLRKKIAASASAAICTCSRALTALPTGSRA